MSKETFNPTVFNTSGNTPISTILNKRLSRRDMLMGTGSGIAAVTAASSLGLAGCAVNPNVNSEVQKLGNKTRETKAIIPTLNFEGIKGAILDAVVVPEGYTAQVLAPWGTPLNDEAAEWKSDGSNTAKDQQNAMGMHHDGMHFFPLNNSSTDGLLCINHEYIDTKALHADNENKDAEFVRKQINAHGVSVVRVSLENNQWVVVKGDKYNRRITAATPINLSGPVAQTDEAVTAYSPDGGKTRGTLNNCGNGFTPWGTYLTCEENWPGYFAVDETKKTPEQKRIGVNSLGAGWYDWHDQAGDATEVDGEFARFNLTPTAETAAGDYRNEANGFGYIVEIDPYNPNSTPVKRTALGRFRHEGVAYGALKEGQPISFYTGHDARFEYLYKFVSEALWDPADANSTDRLATGAKYMDKGTLYVARFDEGGVGEWLPLTLDSITKDGGAFTGKLADTFDSLEAIIINTAGAADLVGATPMDRPEWTTVDPLTGMVYLSLTNNTKRTEEKGVNPANPRLDNAFGHIIRWNDTHETSFSWDIFVYGAPVNKSEADRSSTTSSSVNKAAETNISGLTPMNQFASPDGLRFDARGILWIQTDNSAEQVTQYTNDQMLAVVPAALVTEDGKPAAINSKNQSAIKRFLVGPNDCEITGLAYTPDYKTFFVNVQHPQNWPYSTDATIPTPEGRKVRPRSATVVIRKIDGSTVGA